MAKYLSCDIETFSSVDLGDCGLHKYMESPDFEILLIGYSFDGSPVRVLDLTDPETDSTEFKKLLMDPEIIKTAWNAPFEMHAFKRWLGVETPPEQWSDTMILALEMGLPGSLERRHGPGAPGGPAEGSRRQGPDHLLLKALQGYKGQRGPHEEPARA